MAKTKMDLLGKKFRIDGKVFTVYGAAPSGFFAHEGYIMKTNDKGEVLNSKFFEYEQVKEHLIKGKHQIGTTKKVSLTLPDEVWEKIEEFKEEWELSQSETFRVILDEYFFGS